MISAPFSARNRGVHRRVDNSFPSTARNGLLHILLDLIDKNYIKGWGVVARELQRIARLPPIAYDDSKVSSINQAKIEAEKIISELSWEKSFDFCEQLHDHLAQDVGQFWNDDFQVEITKTEVQVFITGELQRLFEEESLAFDFTDGLVRRRGRKHTVDLASRAQVVLGDPRLAAARTHYDKALKFFRNPSSPDYENTVKEAVCAVEAAGKSLFPNAKASTLGDLAKWLGTTKEVSVPKALIQTITGIYAYRSGGDGIGHGGSAGGIASAEVAEYVLAVCASQIIYFVDVSTCSDNYLPF